MYLIDNKINPISMLSGKGDLAGIFFNKHPICVLIPEDLLAQYRRPLECLWGRNTRGRWFGDSD